MMAVTPELKDVHVFAEGDVNGDFCVSLVLDIGPADVYGADQFYATVGTAQGIADFLSTKPFIICRGFVVVPEFNLKAIKDCIQVRISECAKDDWEQTALSINRLFPWEYDEMKDYKYFSQKTIFF
ncbi:Imm8 family immunity protein [Paenibacillus piscarius]|uniref:Imm8 family immunity protein n=1 Tax=Paenibacillus piscarius TaxID=1089681 RepID=UPI001EE8B407|nr:Imm8 family immunity protein [Paenibacillus piscarius]